MSSRYLLPRVTEHPPTSGDSPPAGKHVGQPHRTPTVLQQLHTSKGSSRRRSFLEELHDQVEKHKEQDREREAQKETHEIHRILQRPRETRDAAEIDTLYEWVMRNGSTIKIFQGAQEIICKTICREMTLLELPDKGVVCHQGDYGDVFFIIITGAVSLYVETKKKFHSDGQNGASNTNQSEPLRSHERFCQQRALSELDDSDTNGDCTSETCGTFIKQIGAGGTFGELAVMDPTARRSCTILCDGPTSFICLKRAAYQRLIRITNSSQLDFTQVEFLETLYVFEKWPHGELMRLSNRLRHMSFPADSHLARIASEANLVFFIYSGIVQETIPLVHHLNDNGNAVKCETVEHDSALRITIQELTLADRKRQQQQRRRVALEVNVYHEHDICGEYPIVFNKPTSNTDLLAVTDVKVLIMDRETWREVFFLHGVDHVRESHRRLRQLAQAREDWRQTRLKLELANPGLHITLSTKAMMQDGKCMCGWCGSRDHLTGDASCWSLAASKQRQADKQKKRDAEKTSTYFSKERRVKTPNDGMTTRAHAVKNTLTFVSQLQDTVSQRKASDVAISLSEADLTSPATMTVHGTIRPETPPTPPSTSRGGIPRRSALRTAAQHIMHEKSQRQSADGGKEDPPSLPVAVEEANVSLQKPTIVTATSVATVPYTRVSTDPTMYDVLQAAREDVPPPVASSKVDDVRKGHFTEELSHQYRQQLVGQAKRITTVQQFYETREKVLEQIQRDETAVPRERHHCNVPRKPKIPKPSRRLAMCAKNREPRPDRFNRKINRVLKKMWTHDHPVPVIEESLRDS